MENECGRRRKKNCHESIIMNKRTTIIGVSRRLFVTVAQCLTRVLYVLFGGVESGQRVKSIHQVSKLALDVADWIDSQYSELLRQQ